jgi:hypothetical protein
LLGEVPRGEWMKKKISIKKTNKLKLIANISRVIIL